MMRSVVAIAVVVFLSATAEPADRSQQSVDCANPDSLTTSERVVCAQHRLEAARRRLDSIKTDIIDRIVKVDGNVMGSPGARGNLDRTKEYREANAAWETFAQKYCRATSSDRGGGEWPKYWEAVCIEELVLARISDVCRPSEVTAPDDVLKGCKPQK
jgi:uncharacterized protein YecT (DUF1311 family)